MRARSAISMMAGLAVASAVGAGGLSQCGELDFAHGGERGHRDLGDGVVSFRVFSIGHGVGSQTLYVEACGSGDVMTAEFKHTEDDPDTGETVVLRDATAATYAVLDDAASSLETVTFAMLEQRFSAAGARTTRGVTDQESCACNRAYPDLRGTRKQFEWYD